MTPPPTRTPAPRVALAAWLLAAASPLAAQPSPAPDPEVARVAALTAGARAALAADAGRLWGARLDTIPWAAVAGGGTGTHAYLTAPAEGFASAGPLWAGALPSDVAPANRSVTLAGRRWAMVVLPLPADSAAAVRLLLHEAMHVAQPALLPLPRYMEGGAGGELLDRPAGRLWLRLEWRALRAALEASGDARARAARDALVFRARRYVEAVPAERRRESVLDLTEGLPEYTAWALTAGEGASGGRAFAATMGRADALPSYVRGFPYYTGPAYAFLLDLHAPGWRRAVVRDTAPLALHRALLAALGDAPAWLSPALADSGTPADRAALERAAEAAGRRYGLDSLRRAEESRWAERERALAALRARFVDGPTVRLRPASLRITLDPNGQVPLGAAGTVMRGVLWRGADGAELHAPEGALVTPDWTELRVPLDSAALAAGPLAAGPLAAPRRWVGAGWTLALPAGWVVTPRDGSWVLTPPR